MSTRACAIGWMLAGSALLTGGIAAAQSAAPRSFSSVRELLDHYDDQIEQSRRSLEAQRLAALERFVKRAGDEQRRQALGSMVGTAIYLKRYDEAAALAERYLALDSSSAEAWGVRRLRFQALVESNRPNIARQEWMKLNQATDANSEDGQHLLQSGMTLAELCLDAGHPAEARELYKSIKTKYAFVPGLDGMIDTQLGLLDWIGRTPPPLEGKDLEGRSVDLKNYRGKVVLLDFWATWCQPCVIAFPELIRTYEQYHDQGFEVIGISLDQSRADAKSFLEKRPLPWRVVCAGQGWNDPNASKYDVSAIPMTFLIDREGKIARAGVPNRGYEPVLERLLAARPR